MPVYRYNPPPTWPPPPPGWSPTPGWQPDPAWGPPPPGWQLWVEVPEPPVTRTATSPMLAVWVAIGVLVALVAAPLLVMAAGLLVAPVSEDVAAEPTRADGAPPASGGQTPTPPHGPPTPATAPEPPGVPDGAQQARVVDVVDGDTLTLAALAAGPVLAGTEPVRVRLLQIDTPERGAPLSDEATAMLGTMAGPGTVLWALRDREPQDRYGRELLYLWTQDGTFVNEQMVRSGLATAVLYEPNDRFIDVMRAAEAEARAAGAGLWSVGEPAAAPAPAPEAEPAPPPPVPAPQPLVQAPPAGGCDPATRASASRPPRRTWTAATSPSAASRSARRIPTASTRTTTASAARAADLRVSPAGPTPLGAAVGHG